MTKLSFPKENLRILLLEGIHRSAVETFRSHGYTNVELLPGALDEDELLARIADVHVIGIRSRTRLTSRVLEAADKLFCVGCFCIGTNQVALDDARRAGIPVFNAPYSNTRSVAELVMGELILLMRGIPEKAAAARLGNWRKTAAHAHEIRGKTLGIVGYGHIGSQVSVLAEALGMQVLFYDIVPKLAIGNARPCSSLEELLRRSDAVTLHVPATAETAGMIGEKEIRSLRAGSILLNLARGNVVDIDALAAALDDGQVRGAAIDVFPKEPASPTEAFASPLQAFDNVILTPHVGGSTQEAQENIGVEVAEKLARYSDNGTTLGAVNFVEVALPSHAGATRFLHIHRNVPGVIAHINEVFSERGLNVAAQYLRTDGEVGYVVVDVDGDLDGGVEVRRELESIEGTVRSRFLM
ncbi:MAG: phosphoglycerate dehydrogenase [Gemmatimonadota bacterium]|jgi:D-3-phosphoglycerate dehydrogenase